MELDRRTLIAGGAALTGLVVAIAWTRTGRSPLGTPREGEMIAGSYLRIAPDGRVTLAMPQCETGQGIWTGLAQAAADELGADWSMVAVEPAPVAGDYDNGYARGLVGKGMRLTALATSIRAFEEPVRDAAAEARARLIRAAADKWGVDPASCDSAGGFVTSGGRRLPFAELVGAASGLSASPKRRAIGTGPMHGQPLGRLDAAAKATGSWRFAGDVRLPDMTFASVRIAPPGGRLVGFDAREAAAPDIRIVRRDTWIAAVGPTVWAAAQALSRGKPRFSGASNASTPDVEIALDRALAGGKRRDLASAGDYDAATEDRLPLAATYRAAPAAPLALEVPAAAARFAGGTLDLWASGRAPSLAIAAAAREAGIGAGDVRFFPTGAGEPEGAGLDPLAAGIAAAIAREVGRPVSLSFPAATAQNQAPLRPPMIARIAALPNPAGGLDSWHATYAGVPGLSGMVGDGDSFDAVAMVPPYGIAALRTETVLADLPPLRTGYARGGDGVLPAFATESFIDELARARGADPLVFRIGLLAGQPRLAKVLSSAARLGGWDGGARGSTMGLACVSAFGSHIALLAQAGLGADQRMKVDRLVAAVDCGRAINPRLVRQQVEGGLLSAMTQVAGPAPEIIAGVARARPLSALGLNRLGALPRIEVAVLPSREGPGGVSGLAALVLAPALANALFAATGMRLRRLPLDPMTPA